MDAPTPHVAMAQGASSREVRLRAEFAGAYPEFEPGIWMGTREVAERLVRRTHTRRRRHLYTRTFDPRHFQVRALGGRERPTGGAGGRARGVDGLPHRLSPRLAE